MSANKGSPGKTESNEEKDGKIGEDKNEACQIMVKVY